MTLPHCTWCAYHLPWQCPLSSFQSFHSKAKLTRLVLPVLYLDRGYTIMYFNVHDWVLFLFVIIKVEAKLNIRCDQPLCEADSELPLITDKHTEIVDYIPCVMVLLLHSANRALIPTIPRHRHSVKCTKTNKETDGQMDDTKLITSLLYAVDNYILLSTALCNTFFPSLARSSN